MEISKKAHILRLVWQIICDIKRALPELGIKCILSTIRSLYRNVPNWFPNLLALQGTGTLNTTRRYSDLLSVLY